MDIDGTSTVVVGMDGFPGSRVSAPTLATRSAESVTSGAMPPWA